MHEGRMVIFVNLVERLRQIQTHIAGQKNSRRNLVIPDEAILQQLGNFRAVVLVVAVVRIHNDDRSARVLAYGLKALFQPFQRLFHWLDYRNEFGCWR